MPTDITSNLLHRFACDEGSGTTLTDSGSGLQNGTIATGGSFSSGKYGRYSFKTDGAANNNVKASFPAAAGVDSLAALTVSFWTKSNTPDDYSFILSHYGGDAANRLEISVAGAGFAGGGNSDDIAVAICTGTDVVTNTTGHPLAGGAWHLVTVVFDGALSQANRIKVYVDGTLATVNSGASPTTTPALSGIGYALGARMGNTLPYKGNVDDLRIYTRALAAADVAALYTLYTTLATGVYFGAGIYTVPTGVTAINFTLRSADGIDADNTGIAAGQGLTDLCRAVRWPSLSATGATIFIDDSGSSGSSSFLVRGGASNNLGVGLADAINTTLPDQLDGAGGAFLMDDLSWVLSSSGGTQHGGLGVPGYCYISQLIYGGGYGANGYSNSMNGGLPMLGMALTI